MNLSLIKSLEQRGVKLVRGLDQRRMAELREFDQLGVGKACRL